LSAVHSLLCGGEPVNASVLRRFLDVYTSAGLDPVALRPCYGLAESTLAVSFTPRGQGLRTDRVSGRALSEQGYANAALGAEEAVEVVDCGMPFPGHEIVAIDTEGVVCTERWVGEIWVRGPSVAAGYANDAAETADAFRADGWLRTGDRGYLAEGRLHVTGRLKDVLVVNGRNVDPQSVEWLAETVPGVRLGGVVAFTRPGTDTEEVVVVAECRPGQEAEVRSAVRKVVAQHLGLRIAEVIAARPGTVLKTTSGKPRRSEMRARHLAGVSKAPA
ncbi:AMP-binding protein, partial [Streptomyces klenkii]|uniref:AMP-binding protein n=1 Tax=Streptomyces klenkii TaxID=1420899 RepID=UPI0033BC278B